MSQYLRQSLLRFTFVAVLFFFARSSRADWPQFLGPARNGISPETGLTGDLVAGCEVLWRVPGGVGMSAVVVQGERAYTTWNKDGQQWLVALDCGSGDEVWATKLAPAYRNQMGDGPRATPTVAGGQVYCFTGEGTLVAVDAESGEPAWSTQAVKDLGGKPSEYGMASSPLVVDGRVIVQVGSKSGSVAAFSTSSGDLVWKSGTASAAYASPALLDVADEEQVVILSGFGLQGLSPATGEQLWDYPFETPYDCNTATPISVNGKIFISAGENHGSVLLQVEKEADAFQVTEVWSSLRTKSVLRSEWQTSVLLDGYLYGFDNVGSAGPVTHLTCIEAQTGKRMWREPRFGKANLTLADGKLWITTMEGELVLVEASPEAYRELGRKALFGQTRQSLSISNGRGFIRDDQDVLCLRLSKAK